MRHAVLAHCDLDLHAGIVDLAEHLLHATDRLAEERGRLGELHHDDLPDLGRTGRTLGNQHILAIALVLGRDEPDAAFVQETADDRLLRALYDLDDASLGTAAPVLADDACLDTVLVQHRAHLVGWQIHVGFAIVALHETVAVAMSLNRTFKFFQHIVGVVIIFDMIALFPEIQNALQGLFLAASGPRWRNW